MPGVAAFVAMFNAFWTTPMLAPTGIARLVTVFPPGIAYWSWNMAPFPGAGEAGTLIVWLTLDNCGLPVIW